MNITKDKDKYSYISNYRKLLDKYENILNSLANCDCPHRRAALNNKLDRIEKQLNELTNTGNK